MADRPMFWLLLASSGVFALGYAAAQSIVMLLCTIPFASMVIASSTLEAARLNRRERDAAIKVAFDFAEKARSMEPIT